MLHRGVATVKYELKRQYGYEEKEEDIKEVIDACEICSKNNRKLGGGCEFVETTAPLEKTAIDIMKVENDEAYVLVFLDYYTRVLRLRLLKNRTTKEITEKLNETFKEIGSPRELNSDNAKELMAKEFFDFCTDWQIRHHPISVEKHNSNGRVERVIRTVRDMLAKTKEIKITMQDKLRLIEQAYNNSFHKEIGRTPEEAWNKNDERLKQINSKKGNYGKTFKKRKREVFIVGQQVRIANKENLKITGKSYDRFQDRGVVTEIAGGDSYIVKAEDGKIYKINHADLKGIRVCA